MVVLFIVVGCLVGVVLGMYAPTISYVYADYLAISIIAALDSVLGGITATLKNNFNFKVFVSGFFANAILSILLILLGNKLNVDIYLAAIIVFVGRMFNNLTIIRRFYIEKWDNMKSQEKEKQNKENSK